MKRRNGVLSRRFNVSGGDTKKLFDCHLHLHTNSNDAACSFNATDLHSEGGGPKIKQTTVPQYIEFTGAIEFTNIECHPFYIIAVLMELVNHGTTTAIPLLEMPIPILEHTCLVENGR